MSKNIYAPPDSGKSEGSSSGSGDKDHFLEALKQQIESGRKYLRDFALLYATITLFFGYKLYEYTGDPVLCLIAMAPYVIVSSLQAYFYFILSQKPFLAVFGTIVLYFLLLAFMVVRVPMERLQSFTVIVAMAGLNLLRMADVARDLWGYKRNSKRG